MVTATNPYLRIVGDRSTITTKGRRALAKYVTDPYGDVYAVTPALSPTTAAAAMARLSRRPGDWRICLLEEFLGQRGQDEALLGRVITDFGDDSVAQLSGLQIVVEGASNLLTKLLEWGRLAAYLEQSTRYIIYDQRDENGLYPYYTPTHLPSTVKMRFMRIMDFIFDTYSTVVRGTTEHVRRQYPRPDKSSNPANWVGWPGVTRAEACDAARPMLPVATRSTVAIFGSAMAIDNLIMFLMSQDIEEARRTGAKILTHARMVAPAFFERTDRPDRGRLNVEYKRETRSSMRRFAEQHLDLSRIAATNNIELLGYSPTNELDLVPGMLYAESGLAEGELQGQVAALSQSERIEAYSLYMGNRLNRRHRPGRAIEEATFKWEIDGRDYGTFRDLQRHRIVNAFEWPKLTPQLGYDLPPLVSEAGYEAEFRRCFAWSEELYEMLSLHADNPADAQYAVLLGHRMRYRFITNLRELFHLIELRTQPAGHPGYRKIANEMYAHVQRVYPLAAAAMKFVNTEDNLPELTRTAEARRAAEQGIAAGAELIDHL